MTGRKREHLKLFFFIVIFISMIFLTVTSIAHYTDFKIDFLNINPTEPTHYHSFTILYPPTTPDIPITDSKGNPVNLPLLSINVGLQYNGTLAEGSRVYISSFGYIYPEGRKNISSATVTDQFNNKIIQNYSVVLGFEGASLYELPYTMFYTPHGEIPVDLISADGLIIPPPSSNSTWPLRQAIEWNNQGDYHPYTVINFNDGTTVYTSYPKEIIHISGSEVVRQEKYARISTWLAVVLFFFTLIASLPLLYSLIPEKYLKKLGIDDENQNTNDTHSDNSQPISNSAQPLTKKSDSPPTAKKKK